MYEHCIPYLIDKAHFRLIPIIVNFDNSQLN